MGLKEKVLTEWKKQNRESISSATENWFKDEITR